MRRGIRGVCGRAIATRRYCHLLPMAAIVAKGDFALERLQLHATLCRHAGEQASLQWNIEIEERRAKPSQFGTNGSVNWVWRVGLQVLFVLEAVPLKRENRKHRYNRCWSYCILLPCMEIGQLKKKEHGNAKDRCHATPGVE
jgi:hypothetical protein